MAMLARQTSSELSSPHTPHADIPPFHQPWQSPPTLRHLHRVRLHGESPTSPLVGSSPSTPVSTAFGNPSPFLASATTSTTVSPSTSTPLPFSSSRSSSQRPLLPMSGRDVSSGIPSQGDEGFINRESLLLTVVCTGLLGMATLGPTITRGWTFFCVISYTILVVCGVVLMGLGVLSATGANVAAKKMASVASRLSLVITILLLELPVLTNLGSGFTGVVVTLVAMMLTLLTLGFYWRWCHPESAHACVRLLTIKFWGEVFAGSATTSHHA